MKKYIYVILLSTVGLSFYSCTTDPVTDIDGNVYKTVQIGSQVWMAENLKVTRYRNGDPIPNVTDNATWTGLSTGAYCDYDNNSSNASTYGHLYNWHAVSDSRNLAPEGWHLPSKSEIETLINNLGGASVAGGKLKSNSWDGTNSSGFSAVSGGYRSPSSGSFGNVGGSLWSTTEYNPTNAWSIDLYSGNNQALIQNWAKGYGLSVRCIKD